MTLHPVCLVCGQTSGNAVPSDRQGGHCTGCGAPRAVEAVPGSGRVLTWLLLIAAGCVGLVVMGGILVVLALPAIQRSREAQRRAETGKTIRELALALHTYHDTNSEFPHFIPNPTPKSDWEAFESAPAGAGEKSADQLRAWGDAERLWRIEKATEER